MMDKERDGGPELRNETRSAYLPLSGANAAIVCLRVFAANEGADLLELERSLWMAWTLPRLPRLQCPANNGQGRTRQPAQIQPALG